MTPGVAIVGAAVIAVTPLAVSPDGLARAMRGTDVDLVVDITPDIPTDPIGGTVEALGVMSGGGGAVGGTAGGRDRGAAGRRSSSSGADPGD